MTVLDLLAKLPHGVLRDAEVILMPTSICMVFEVAMPADVPSLAFRVRGETFRFIYTSWASSFVGLCSFAHIGL
jgi:hypothetical protein